MQTESDALLQDKKQTYISLRVLTPKLLQFHQIPEWQQDNEFILSGYR
jgi:hypothetical protein